MSKELAEIFTQKYVLNLGGNFIELECPIKGYKTFIYKEGNIKTCVLAGGCFWCVGKPYYEYDGIIRVFSGYSGGNKVMPSYEEVKSQLTHHRECIKLIYDENIISYEEILDIYFETIDPLDAEGQFIDRGESYTSALYYKTEEMKDFILQYIKNEEEKIKKKFMVKLLPEEIFYMAEEYHQDYAVKNPELMEEELILSGRKNDL
ncbi:MAG: peptide-methionine (S)-S-oxide reductase MsrA [Bacilli bacterium]|nr:peptide-methionine (S)-S-oxide reductase MsrA [Bacilli bacterium]